MDLIVEDTVDDADVNIYYSDKITIYLIGTKIGVNKNQGIP